MEKIIEVKALDNYQLFVHFEDGTKGEIDLKHLLEFPAFEPWKNYEFFKSVFIGGNNGVPTWNDDLDIDALNIYLHLKGISFEEYVSKKNERNAA